MVSLSSEHRMSDAGQTRVQFPRAPLMNTMKVGGGGKAAACGGARWIEFTRERTGKPWLQPARSQYKQYCKRRKVKHERQKARFDPECAPTYGRYQGYDD